MEVKINIEAGQIGDTVIDLFKNISKEKKEELALSIMKEWLQSPEFFETKNKESIIIEEFRNGERRPYWGEKFNKDTPENMIKSDTNYKKALENYKTSKQVMVEDLKLEIIKYYKEYITNQIANHKLINKIKDETYKEIVNIFPEIITQVMIQTFAQNISSLQYQIQDSAMKSNMTEQMTRNIMTRLNIS